MKCANCGSVVDSTTGKCTICGTEVSVSMGDTTNQTETNQNTYQNQYNNQPPINMYSSNMYYEQKNQPVSVGRWIGRMFISWIPLVGGIVYLIMLIIWAYTDKFEQTSKNWAIASLIMVIINIIVGVVIVLGIISIITSAVNDSGLQRELEMYMRTLPIY